MSLKGLSDRVLVTTREVFHPLLLHSTRQHPLARICNSFFQGIAQPTLLAGLFARWQNLANCAVNGEVRGGSCIVLEAPRIFRPGKRSSSSMCKGLNSCPLCTTESMRVSQGGPCSLVPFQNCPMFPCSHTFSECFRTVIFRILFPCSQKLANVPLFPSIFYQCSLVPQNPWETLINVTQNMREKGEPDSNLRKETKAGKIRCSDCSITKIFCLLFYTMFKTRCNVEICRLISFYISFKNFPRLVARISSILPEKC